MMYSLFVSYIEEQEISPFSEYSSLPHPLLKRFVTREGKRVVQKVFSQFKQHFVFKNTAHLLHLFDIFSSEENKTSIRSFFESIRDMDFHVDQSSLQKERASFRLPYSYTAITADEETYAAIKRKQIPVHLLISEWDLQSVHDYDVIEAIDCEQFESALDQLDHVQFVTDVDALYPEQSLSLLSEYRSIISTLATQTDLLSHSFFPATVKKNLLELYGLLDLLDIKQDIDSAADIQVSLREVNQELEEKLKEMTFEGGSLFEILSQGRLPQQVTDSIRLLLKEHNIPESLISLSVPVTFDEEAYEEQVKEDLQNSHLQFKQKLHHSKAIYTIPDKIQKLESLLLILDCIHGLKTSLPHENVSFAEIADTFVIEQSTSLFLDDPQPIDYCLDHNYSCAVLTGANSGGKTTLLEHLIQILVLGYMGIPIPGKAKIPYLEHIYYFSKQKGSTSKGAFETLLTQFSSIKGSQQTLVLADEIEAVTEPGIAARIILSIVDYFQRQGTFLVIATHLGQDIVDHLPKNVRIDGIQAKGIDEENQLMVDHNPVLGTLARSTPELIIRRLANHSENEFIHFLSHSLDSTEQ